MALICLGMFAGMVLARKLPREHLDSDSRDAIKLGAGMVSMMSALVLGLLVSSAKSNFDGTSEAVTQSSAKVIVLDRLLAAYGPEAAGIRDTLRRNVSRTLEMLWQPAAESGAALKAFESATGGEDLLKVIRGLRPETPAQAAVHNQMQTVASDLVMTRWLQIEQAHVPLPLPMLAVLLFWLTTLFLSFGLLAPRNATVTVVLFAGALAVASAIFLILELHDPMDGVIRVPQAPMAKALEMIGK